MNDCVNIYGELISKIDFTDLFEKLKSSEFNCKIGDSSHYTGHIYLSMVFNSANVYFEKITPNEFLIGGDSDKESDLKFLSQYVSNIFTQEKIKHRLELYDKKQNEFDYFHYNWPK